MSKQYLGVGGRMVTVGGKAVKMPSGAAADIFLGLTAATIGQWVEWE